MVLAEQGGSWRDTYRAGLRSAVRGLWQGAFDYYQSWNIMDITIRNGFTHAWQEGAERAGISWEELTPDERTELENVRVTQMQYVDGLLTAAEQNAKAEGGKLTPLLDRVERFWVTRYDDVEQKAFIMASGDEKLIWTLHAGESCKTCLALSGKIKRGSFWRDHVMPNSHKLDCVKSAGGIPVCRCTLDPTDLPVSRGPLPGLL